MDNEPSTSNAEGSKPEERPRAVAVSRSQKGSSMHSRMKRVLKEESESDSDDEDVQGFVRIIVISKRSQDSESALRLKDRAASQSIKSRFKRKMRKLFAR